MYFSHGVLRFCNLSFYFNYFNFYFSRVNHRKYSLVFKEREAFIPDDSMIIMPRSRPDGELGFYQQKVLDKNKFNNLTDSIEKLELQRQSLHW